MCCKSSKLSDVGIVKSGCGPRERARAKRTRIASPGLILAWYGPPHRSQGSGISFTAAELPDAIDACVTLPVPVIWNGVRGVILSCVLQEESPDEFTWLTRHFEQEERFFEDDSR